MKSQVQQCERAKQIGEAADSNETDYCIEGSHILSLFLFRILLTESHGTDETCHSPCHIEEQTSETSLSENVTNHQTSQNDENHCETDSFLYPWNEIHENNAEQVHVCRR